MPNWPNFSSPKGLRRRKANLCLKLLKASGAVALLAFLLGHDFDVRRQFFPVNSASLACIPLIPTTDRKRRALSPRVCFPLPPVTRQPICEGGP